MTTTGATMSAIRGERVMRSAALTVCSVPVCVSVGPVAEVRAEACDPVAAACASGGSSPVSHSLMVGSTVSLTIEVMSACDCAA